MLVKLAVYGALGYAGYRYLTKTQAVQRHDTPNLALAGGPLSSQATIQSDPDVPPASIASTANQSPT